MADQLTYFIEGFSSRYQDVLSKTLVADKVANRRLESDLAIGKKFSRFILDLSGVRVRSESRYSDRSIDTMSDSTEYIEIDQEKYMGTKMHKWEKLQNGPLKAGQEAGKQLAQTLKQYVDADVFAQVINANDSFDDGDIGGTDGNGLDFSINNIPKVASLLPAKLKANNVSGGNMCHVLDPVMIANIEQTLMGKDIQSADTTFKNGYSGNLVKFEVYESNNLTYTAKLTPATNPVNTETVVIGGVTFTFVDDIGAAAGNVHIGATTADTIDNLVALINDPATTTAQGVALSAANIIKIRDTYRIAATDGTTYMTIKCVGSGRLTISETLSDGAWSLKKLHCYSGKKNQIDIVMQQDVSPDIRPEPKQPVNNLFVDALYGLKFFADAKKNVLDLQILV
jgi:hypothetical protein